MARPRSVSDEDVFAAVRESVLAQGPQVSLDVVADRVGVTAPALFRRFGSRAGLLLAALRPPLPPFIAELERGPDERAVEVQLIEIITSITSYMADSMPCMSALRESGIPMQDIFSPNEEPAPLRGVRAMKGWLDRLAKKGRIAVADTHIAAMTIIGATHMPVFLKHLTNEQKVLNIPSMARGMARVLLRGLCPASERATKTKRARNSNASAANSKERS